MARPIAAFGKSLQRILRNNSLTSWFEEFLFSLEQGVGKMYSGYIQLAIGARRLAKSS